MHREYVSAHLLFCAPRNLTAKLARLYFAPFAILWCKTTRAGPMPMLSLKQGLSCSVEGQLKAHKWSQQRAPDVALAE